MTSTNTHFVHLPSATSILCSPSQQCDPVWVFLSLVYSPLAGVSGIPTQRMILKNSQYTRVHDNFGPVKIKKEKRRSRMSAGMNERTHALVQRPPRFSCKVLPLDDVVQVSPHRSQGLRSLIRCPVI